MALNQLAKINFNALIKKYPLDYIDYYSLIHLSNNQKYTESDLLEYVADKTLSTMEKEEKSKTTLWKLIHCICLILTNCGQDHIKLDNQSILKVIKIKELYPKYIEKNNLQEEKEAIAWIKSLEEVTEFDYRLPKEKIEEEALVAESEKILKNEQTQIIEYESTIKELQSSIETLEKELKQKNSSEKNLQYTNQQLRLKLNELKETMTTSRIELKKLTQDLKTQSEINIETKQLYEKLINQKETLEQEYETLKKELELTLIQLEKNQKELKRYQLNQEKIILKEQQEKQIEERMIERIYQNPCSTDELMTYLTNQGITITKSEVYQHLLRIKQRIKIKEPSFKELPPKYEIDSSLNLKQIDFYLDPSTLYDDKVCLNILLLSDPHYTTIDKTTLKTMDTINNYCIINNVPITLNLGDFFDCPHHYCTIENLKIYESLIQEAIEKIPQTPEIYHGIQGGNHEDVMLKHGMDPINQIATAREDFFNLGYKHSRIIFGKNKTTQNTIALHHPSIRFQEEIVDLTSKNLLTIEKYLEDYYRNKKEIRQDIYLDIIGHVHKSKLDYPNSYCLVPSYRKNRGENGAWHLKIYFNKLKQIEYIILIPLVLQEKLIPTSEMVYKKIVKR